MKFDSRRSTVMARNGMVATSQPLAAMAGLRTMMQGGNAVDAAVATAGGTSTGQHHQRDPPDAGYCEAATSEGEVLTMGIH